MNSDSLTIWSRRCTVFENKATVVSTHPLGPADGSMARPVFVEAAHGQIFRLEASEGRFSWGWWVWWVCECWRVCRICKEWAPAEYEGNIEEGSSAAGRRLLGCCPPIQVLVGCSTWSLLCYNGYQGALPCWL